MRIPLILAILAFFSACESTHSIELFTGVTASDQAGISAAARAITNSPITGWRLWPDTTKPTEVLFWTKEGKIYSAKKIGGKWHITDITNAIVRSTNDLTNRWSQPLAVAMCTFDFMKQSFVFGTLALASGGSAPSR